MHYGTSEINADKVIQELIHNELSGYSSHGIRRIFSYIDDIKHKKLDVLAMPQIKTNLGENNVGITRIHGNNAFGVLVMESIVKAIKAKVLKHPLSAVCVKNGHHVGRLHYLANQLSREPYNLILIGFCNYLGGGARVAIPDNQDSIARLCTNPILWSFPIKNRAPFVLDMSTTNISEGCIAQSLEKNKMLPEGWLINTQDPKALYSSPPEATMASLGYPFAAHKGYGMAVFCEAMVGMLTGSNHVADPRGYGNGLFILAINPDYFNQDAESLGAKIIQACYQSENSENFRYPGNTPDHCVRSDSIEISETLYKKIIHLKESLSCP